MDFLTTRMVTERLNGARLLKVMVRTKLNFFATAAEWNLVEGVIRMRTGRRVVTLRELSERLVKWETTVRVRRVN